MPSPKEFNRYDMSSVKLRSDTSHMSGDRVFYIVKKFADGTTSKLYAAFDFKSGITVGWDQNKADLIIWLDDNIDKIETKLKEAGE